MELIEKDDLNKFMLILKSHHVDVEDFSLEVVDTTDPKTDEIYALQGLLTVTRKSNGRSNEYSISDDTSWLPFFLHDLDEGFFG